MTDSHIYRSVFDDVPWFGTLFKQNVNKFQQYQYNTRLHYAYLSS